MNDVFPLQKKKKKKKKLKSNIQNYEKILTNKTKNIKTCGANTKYFTYSIMERKPLFVRFRNLKKHFFK